MKTEYQKWLKKAQAKDWKTPANNAIPEHSWIAYWQACEAYERDPSAGRPTVPHRSGGGQMRQSRYDPTGLRK